VREYAVDLLIGMVKIYSPSGQEGELANFLSNEMAKLGFDVEIDRVGNVIGKLGEGRPRILLCGHMDTIPGIIKVRVEEGILYGRGTVDAKGPLATMIIAAAQLVDEGYDGEIIVVGAVDEEGRGRGVKHLVQEEIDVDYAVFGEPTNVETMTIGYKGSLHIKVTFETETGHSSAPWLFENSVEKAIEVWELIKDRFEPKEVAESKFNTVTICLRRVEGGGQGSVVPNRCEIHVELRIPPSITTTQFQGDVLELIDGYRKLNPAVNLKVEILDSTEPYVADRRSLLVRALTRSIWKTRKTQAKLIYKTATGDMNVFGNATGKPTITYGPGDSHLDHTPNEHIPLVDYLNSIEVLKEALRGLVEMHRKF
jgi:LysW-gamma-L-lysine carboxypeptidase